MNKRIKVRFDFFSLQLHQCSIESNFQVPSFYTHLTRKSRRFTIDVMVFVIGNIHPEKERKKDQRNSQLNRNGI